MFTSYLATPYIIILTVLRVKFINSTIYRRTNLVITVYHPLGLHIYPILIRPNNIYRA